MEEIRLNNIYTKLVENENDLTGMIAYSIYKIDKIKYIEEHISAKEYSPSDEELRKYQLSKCDNHNYILECQTKAREKIYKFVNHLLIDKISELEKFETSLKEREQNIETKESSIKEKQKNLKNQENKIKNRDKYCNVSSKHSFWLGVLQNLISTFLIMILSIIFLLNSKIPTTIEDNIVKNIEEKINNNLK